MPSLRFAVDQYRRWVQLHAACMVMAWLLLVPIGLSMASQRWACSNGEYKGCAPWLWLHFLFTAGGLGTFGYGGPPGCACAGQARQTT